jgi:hypothetical protein
LPFLPNQAARARPWSDDLYCVMPERPVTFERPGDSRAGSTAGDMGATGIASLARFKGLEGRSLDRRRHAALLGNPSNGYR